MGYGSDNVPSPSGWMSTSDYNEWKEEHYGCKNTESIYINKRRKMKGEFVVENIFTWGLTQDKDYGGYKLPVSFRDENKIVNQIQKMVIKQGAKPVFYGDSKTLYFKLWNLSEKQSSELLEKGRCYVDIKFVVRDKPVASKKTEELFLGIEVLGLRYKSKVLVGATPDDEF